MYVVTVTFVIKDNCMPDFLKKMTAQAENSLTLEQGCFQFDVCMDQEDQNTIFLYEVYQDRKAFDDHLSSNHFKEFDSAVRNWFE